MQNKFFTFLLSTFLLMVVIFSAPQAFALENTVAEEKNIQNIVESPDANRLLIEEMNNSPVTKPRMQNIEENTAKAPYQKTDDTLDIVPKVHKELFGVAFMFIKVMFAVLASSVLIYFLLLFVRKFYGNNLEEKIPKWDDEVDLRTPKNDSSALKGFLNQTKNR